MTSDIALELKVARRNAGLRQRDCARLLGVHPSRVSKLESGANVPSITDLYILSLIYGKPIDRFLSGIKRELHSALAIRLATMPKAPRKWLGKMNRLHTMQTLARRLEALTKLGYGA